MQEEGGKQIKLYVSQKGPEEPFAFGATSPELSGYPPLSSPRSKSNASTAHPTE